MTIEQSRELLRLVRAGIKVSPFRVQIALETLVKLQERQELPEVERGDRCGPSEESSDPVSKKH